jgi:uncharacterized protein (TIGR02594 family)
VSAPAWLIVADAKRGIREVPGPASHPTILSWAKYLTGWWRAYFTNDDTAWCALFVNACLGEAGHRGTGTLRAADFMKWGVALTERSLGCILVFNRPSGYHVGFYLGETATHVLVRGGNQGNAVSDVWISKVRLIAHRWPTTAMLPRTGRLWLTQLGAPVSTDES